MAQTTGGIEKPTRTRTGGHKAVASTPPDSAAVTVKPSTYERTPVLDEAGDTVKFEPNDSLILTQATFVPDTAAATNLGKLRVFNPDPKRAMWLSALCPGLGQIYNRRYWKIPIVVGAFVGLGYGTAWNNRMLGDYTKAYRDITDNDPNTRSYMNFFPKTVKESDARSEKQANILPPLSRHLHHQHGGCVFHQYCRCLRRRLTRTLRHFLRPYDGRGPCRYRHEAVPNTVARTSVCLYFLN